MQDNYLKIILETTLLTIYYIVVFFFFALVSISLLAPQWLIGAYDAMGLDRAKAYMYERVYNKTEKNEDLYNVIEVYIQTENYNKIIKYINVMQNKSNYESFCELVDNRNTANVSKEFYVYVCDYDAYLKNQYVLSLYNSGRKDRAKEVAFEGLIGNSNLYAWEFGAYVDCVMSDDTLESDEKKATLAAIYDTTINNFTIQEWINNNLDMIEDPDSKEGFERLESLHQIIVIMSTNKILAEAKDDTTLADSLISSIEAYMQVRFRYLPRRSFWNCFSEICCSERKTNCITEHCTLMFPKVPYLMFQRARMAL